MTSERASDECRKLRSVGPEAVIRANPLTYLASLRERIVRNFTRKTVLARDGTEFNESASEAKQADGGTASLSLFIPPYDYDFIQERLKPGHRRASLNPQEKPAYCGLQTRDLRQIARLVNGR